MPPWSHGCWIIGILLCICVISGSRREVAEICTLLGYYAAGSGNLLPMFRDNGSHPQGSYIIILLACLLLIVASSTIYPSLSFNMYQFFSFLPFPPFLCFLFCPSSCTRMLYPVRSRWWTYRGCCSRMDAARTSVKTGSWAGHTQLQ